MLAHNNFLLTLFLATFFSFFFFFYFYFCLNLFYEHFEFRAMEANDPIMGVIENLTNDSNVKTKIVNARPSYYVPSIEIICLFSELSNTKFHIAQIQIKLIILTPLLPTLHNARYQCLFWTYKVKLSI